MWSDDTQVYNLVAKKRKVSTLPGELIPLQVLQLLCALTDSPVSLPYYCLTANEAKTTKYTHTHRAGDSGRRTLRIYKLQHIIVGLEALGN